MTGMCIYMINVDMGKRVGRHYHKHNLLRNLLQVYATDQELELEQNNERTISL